LDEKAPNQEVAIKIIRSSMTIMRTSGEKEIEVISALNKADPNDKKHIIRLIENFEYNQHLCIVYESLH
jgi:serine/threonine-protein kinase PRP4